VPHSVLDISVVLHSRITETIQKGWNGAGVACGAEHVREILQALRIVAAT
jgi:hypothetical protein